MRELKITLEYSGGGKEEVIRREMIVPDGVLLDDAATELCADAVGDLVKPVELPILPFELPALIVDFPDGDIFRDYPPIPLES